MYARPCRGTSSSTGMEGPQPMAVEPDPMVRRGLKRASEGLLKFLWESSPMRRNAKSCWAELASVDEFDAKKDIPRDQATGPLLTFTWVRTVKNEAPNYRLCLRPFCRQSERSKDSLYCPTPGPQTYKMLLVLAAHHGWSVRSFDEPGVPAHTHQNSCVRFST